MKTRVALLAVVTMAYGGVPLPAQQKSQDSVKADRVERVSENTLRATGNVAIEGDGFHLRADSVEMRKTTVSGDEFVELIAEGNVVLARGQERLTLQRLQLNPSTGAGVFQLPQHKK